MRCFLSGWSSPYLPIVHILCALLVRSPCSPATATGYAKLNPPHQPQLTPAQQAAQAALTAGNQIKKDGLVPVRTGLAWAPLASPDSSLATGAGSLLTYSGASLLGGSGGGSAAGGGAGGASGSRAGAAGLAGTGGSGASDAENSLIHATQVSCMAGWLAGGGWVVCCMWCLCAGGYMRWWGGRTRRALPSLGSLAAAPAAVAGMPRTSGTQLQSAGAAPLPALPLQDLWTTWKSLGLTQLLKKAYKQNQRRQGSSAGTAAAAGGAASQQAAALQLQQTQQTVQAALQQMQQALQQSQVVLQQQLLLSYQQQGGSGSGAGAGGSSGAGGSTSAGAGAAGSSSAVVAAAGANGSAAAGSSRAADLAQSQWLSQYDSFGLTATITASGCWPVVPGPRCWAVRRWLAG